MRKRSSVLALLLLGAIAVATAQTQRSSTAPRPSADLLARRQFAAALEEYRAQPASIELRDKVIRLARALKTAPAVPEDATNFFTQGMAQIQKAQSADEIKVAAKQFEQAAQAAPWFADAYRALGAAFDKLGDYQKEREWLLLYMAAARDTAGMAEAQNLVKDVDAKQVQAEFDRSLAGIKRNPNDFSLRANIVRRAASSNPPLPVPEETERYMARGKVAFEDAKEAPDFKDAVAQFQRARDAAPWYGPVYYSLGVAYSAAGDYKAAKDNLSVYLAWNLDASQIKAAKELIYQIDYRQEKAQAEETKRQAADEADRRKVQARRALIAGLNGAWTCKQGCGGTATVQLQQGNFTLSFGTWVLKGTFNEFAVDGIATQPGFYQAETTCQIPGANHDFSGTVSEDGKTITIRTEMNNYTGHWVKPAGLFAVKTCSNVELTSTEPFMITIGR